MFSLFKSNADTAADLYIDLGTANTIMSGRGHGVVLNEPTVVIYSESGTFKKKILAVGREAREIYQRTPGHIRIANPVRDGVIADFELAQEMLRRFLTRPEVKKVHSRPRVIISLPYGVTEVEKKAVIQACMHANARSVFLIDEPMAAAIGAGLPVEKAAGNMIIDIGGGTTEVAVIALADIVYCEAVRVGGHRLDDTILEYLKRERRILVAESIAEDLKISIGSAMPRKDIRTQTIQGRDADTGLPKTIDVSSEEIGQAMNGCLQEIIDATHRAIEHTPPELVSDIIESGITLAGGGALIRDLPLRLSNEVRLPVKVAAEPLIAIAKGGEKVLSSPELLNKIILEV